MHRFITPYIPHRPQPLPPNCPDQAPGGVQKGIAFQLKKVIKTVCQHESKTSPQITSKRHTIVSTLMPKSDGLQKHPKVTLWTILGRTLNPNRKRVPNLLQIGAQRCPKMAHVGTRGAQKGTQISKNQSKRTPRTRTWKNTQKVTTCLFVI